MNINKKIILKKVVQHLKYNYAYNQQLKINLNG